MSRGRALLRALPAAVRSAARTVARGGALAALGLALHPALPAPPRGPLTQGAAIAREVLPSLASMAQNDALVGSFRPYLHVLLAFAAAWLIIGAWVFRIGRKLDRVARRMAEESPRELG